MLHSTGLIKKAKLTFASKFFWMIVLNRPPPMSVDNILIWDRAVMVVALVAESETDFVKL